MPVDASETDDAAVEAVERALNNTNTDPRRANGTWIVSSEEEATGCSAERQPGGIAPTTQAPMR